MSGRGSNGDPLSATIDDGPKAQYPCGICNGECKAGSIQCGICPRWHHLSCAKVPTSVLPFIQTGKNKVEGLLWRCQSCQDKSIRSNISYIEQKFETFENKINSLKPYNRVDELFDDKIKEMEQRMEERLKIYSSKITNEIPTEVERKWAVKTDTKPESFKDIVKEAMQDQKKAEDEKELRNASLIIYRVEESSSQNFEERKKQDTQFFNTLCEDILELGSIETQKIIRLGKKNDYKDEATKSMRPMKVVLKNKEQRDQILKNATKLGNAEKRFKNISITFDYTKEEREEIKIQVKEAQRKSENDLNYFYKVRGPPWNLSIRKFEKRH